MPPIRLTHDENEALRGIRDGADVFSHGTASALRAVAARYPELLDIGQPAGEYGPHDAHPYLGAILTKLGRALVDPRRIRKGARCETAGRGKTYAWKHQQGTVIRRSGSLVYVRWDGCTFEDEMSENDVQGVIELPAKEAA